MAARSDGMLTIGQAAAAAGTTASVLRIWSERYGWPSPPRTAAGYRLFHPREVERIRWVREQHAAGRPLAEILAGGRPDIPSVHPAAQDRRHVDITAIAAIPMPTSQDGRDVRARLELALIHRNAGMVRWALAQRPRLRPGDRDSAVDAVLRAAAAHLDLHAAAWLAPTLEPDHVF